MLHFAKILVLAVAVLFIAKGVWTRAIDDQGLNVRQKRMIRGRNADSIDWKFISYLTFHQSNPKWKICGGALIKEDWVLTAGHCVHDIFTTPEHITVTVGKTKRSSSNNDIRTYNASKIVVHKGFLELIANYNESNQEYFNWDYDIALIKLSSPVKGDIIDLPIDKYEVSDNSEVKCKAAGWGSQHELKRTASTGATEYTPPDDLQEIDVPIVRKAICRLYHGKEVSDIVFCGGDIKQGTMTSCLGDSGSPLVCTERCSDKSFLAGIVIGGDYLCRTGNQYMMFTEIAKYKDWINKIISV